MKAIQNILACILVTLIVTAGIGPVKVQAANSAPPTQYMRAGIFSDHIPDYSLFSGNATSIAATFTSGQGDQDQYFVFLPPANKIEVTAARFLVLNLTSSNVPAGKAQLSLVITGLEDGAVQSTATWGVDLTSVEPGSLAGVFSSRFSKISPNPPWADIISSSPLRKWAG